MLIFRLALIAVVLFAPLAFAEHGGSLPWQTLSGAAKDTVAAGMGRCPGGEIFRSDLRTPDGRTWTFFYAPETGRFVFAEFGPDEKPAVLWFGTPDPKDNDRIRITGHRRYDKERDRGGPCPLLFPKTA